MKGKFNGSIKKTLTLSACALAVWAATSMPAMAESVELRVKGTIIPAACVPKITGEVDYGDIASVRVTEAQHYVLEAKVVDFSIACDAPAKVALKVVNGRPGTVAGAQETGKFNTAASPVKLFSGNGLAVAGLGADGDDAIGGYTLVMDAAAVADTKPVRIINKFGTGTTEQWKLSSNTVMYSDPTDVDVKLTSWASTTGTLPVAFEYFQSKIHVQAYLNKRSELDLTKDIQLDGLSTIELVYL